MQKNTNNGIAKASIILFVGTLISKALGFFREVIVAYRFGTGAVSDAFLLTNSIPNLIFSAVGITITINFIPYFTRIENKKEQDLFTSNLLNILLSILVIGCILVCVFPEIVLSVFAAGLKDETKYYAIPMLRIVVFSIIPILCAHLFQAYSQAKGGFASTALFGTIVNVTVIVFTLLGDDQHFRLLSVGTVLANIFGMLITIPGLKKNRFHYSLSYQLSQVKGIVLLTIPLLSENIASSLSLIADRNLASFLDKGTISGLSYGGTIGDIAGAVIATPIITATYPTFSKYIARGSQEDFQKQFLECFYVLGYILIPVSFFLIFNAQDIVSLIFEHGRFNEASTVVVSESMICYAVGVIPMGLQSYLIRGFYALQDTKTPVKIKVFALICNIVLNILSVRYLRHIGIALSTSVSYIIALILLIRYIGKKHKVCIISGDFYKYLLVVITAGLASWGISEGCRAFLHEIRIIRLLASGFLCVVVYFMIVFLLSPNMLGKLKGFVSKKT